MPINKMKSRVEGDQVIDADGQVDQTLQHLRSRWSSLIWTV